MLAAAWQFSGEEFVGAADSRLGIVRRALLAVMRGFAGTRTETPREAELQDSSAVLIDLRDESGSTRPWVVVLRAARLAALSSSHVSVAVRQS
jgi:hypothetical protein